MVKKTFRKFTRIGKLKAMISGGLGKKGPYLYGGVKSKKGLSIGASIGTEGRNLYGSVNKRSGQARLKYNMETKSVKPRLKVKKKKLLKSFFR